MVVIILPLLFLLIKFSKMRRYKHLILIAFITVLSNLTIFGQTKKDSYKMDIFISNLMKKMSLEEKLGQLNLITPVSLTGPFATTKYTEKLKNGSGGNVYAVMGKPAYIHSKVSLSDSSRLKIPLLVGLDIIHGYKTIFPIPLGLACTWDTDIVVKTARVAAIEATAAGYNWTFSPMLDITRDPRWGRVMEGSGEDPYLGSLIAKAMVKGYQGSDLKNETSLMACIKHFAMYGAAEAGRDYNTTDMSQLAMYQNFLPPYKAAIDAGAGSVMTSFNEINGVPATCNKWLLKDLLRKEWGFNGFIVTDYNAIQELIAHGVAENYKQAAELALNAGVDMDMASESMIASFKQSLLEKNISMSQINDACRRVLEAKYKLGLFSNPFRNNNPDKADIVTLTKENLKTAKEAAVKSIVLLKNDNYTLPLSRTSKIALIGPFADNKSEMFSMWSFTGDEKKVVTLFESLKNQDLNVEYAEGSQITDNTYFNELNNITFDSSKQEKMIAHAIDICKNADVIVVMLGESKNMSGEAKSFTDISLPHCQSNLLKKIKTTGKPVVLILTNGRPMTLENDLLNADAVLETWRLGTEAGDAISDVLFGNYNPSGKITMSFPRSVGQIPIYYNHKNTGRPYTPGGKSSYVSNYQDKANSPLFPFGYGLSYTTFKYSDIRLSDTLVIGEIKTLKATVKVTNSGKFAGEETVQLYLNDPVASVTRPVKELKQFNKVFLQPGETKDVCFTLTTEDLKFYNSDLKWDWESGSFIVYIGTNSDDVKMSEFIWKK